MSDRHFHDEWFCEHCHGKIIVDVDRETGKATVSSNWAGCPSATDCSKAAIERCGFSGFVEQDA